MLKKFFTSSRWCVAVIAVSIATAFVIGPQIGVGMALGLGSTIINFLGLWGVIWILKQDSFDRRQKFKVAGLVLLFLGSLPLSLWCIVHAQGLKNGAPGAYLCGLAMVYCWAVGWAESTKP